MKKVLFSILLLTSATFMVSAQELHLGAKVGANLNKIDGQPFKSGFQLGYQLGGFLELDFSKTIGIQPEVLFNQTNTKYAQTGSDIINGVSDGAKQSFNYLSIPVLLRINPSNLITLNLGPQYSILMNKDRTLVENGKDAFKSGDFGLVAGAQINLKSLRVYGRYVVGLSDIGDATNSNKWKSQQIQLGLGLKIF